MYNLTIDIVLFNNKEILVGGMPVFITEWFDSNILSIRDLLNSNGQLLSFQEFNNQCDCNTNFLQFYQCIPKILSNQSKKYRATGKRTIYKK